MTVAAQTQLTITDCCVCGIVFGMPERVINDRKNKGGNFYCPNGHSLSYRETELDRLRKETEHLNNVITHERDQREATERSLNAYKGHLTKLRKRIDQGVCPHCQRTFKNVMLHMSHKHPEKVEEAREAKEMSL